ncbi:putative cytochrome P450 [Aspergillus taichungensis]|uniref:Bifunctional cytochrome P450/NADPH--P450 reductase n=1 Tax=Aspergillus taichungensis TaxID=482145 RepID=A0A2J5I767_9EURO|nr:putative cytochrome P450 [Aspergillus taichungensis]
MVEIPEPSGLPFLGNIGSIDQDFPLGSFVSLADELGEIYRLRFPGSSVVVVSTHALVDETCDETRFRKSLYPALKHLRDGAHDGLFTAEMGEVNWDIAHRVLMPAFGPLSIRGMFDEMHDIASQLALKWARYGHDVPIMVTDDFTRLAFDTLAICSMGYRFNSYYSPTLHPFIQAMADFLTEGGEKSLRPPLPGIFFRAREQKFQNAIAVLRETAKGVFTVRKAGQSDSNDLLAAMLRGVDAQTGRKMTDESIMDNMITFLIAGHETTAGLLSFVFYQLLTDPEIYRKAQQEVDAVVGQGVIDVSHLSKLPYINGILRETLRFNAPIPQYTVEAFEDTLLAGKYPVRAGEPIINLLAKSHLDPAVYGDDAGFFRPERMLDDAFNARQKKFPNAWKPFGNGIRACLGRAFAWQEALLAMAMLLQNFDFSLQPNYQLHIKQTLTIRPKDMIMRATLRHGLTPTTLERRLTGLAAETPRSQTSTESAADAQTGIPLTVLYGTNSGTCDTLARRIAVDAPSRGFRVVQCDSLDRARDALPRGAPIVIVTPSYEGQPPDNAKQFVAWLEDLNHDDQPLRDVSYAVFGCGHKEWAQTLHRIPKLVDSTLEQLGATRLTDLGLTDVASDELFSTFETWAEHTLWPQLMARYTPGTVSPSVSPRPEVGVEVTMCKSRTQVLRQDVGQATVVDTQVLTSEMEKERRKIHLEIRLPEGLRYSAGDYLAILPINPPETVRRAMRQFKLPWDAQVKIAASSPTTALPTGRPVAASDILSSYVELSQPTTRKDLTTLAGATTDADTKVALETYANDTYADDILAKSVSVLDILEIYPAIDLPLGSFLLMLPSMRLRQYSISSSPLWNPKHATITLSILDAPSRSSQGGHRHLGVASSYLESLRPGDIIQVTTRKSGGGFSMPDEPDRTPMICIAAGTGLAPFRGFLQERAALSLQSRPLAPALLFFGCRAPGQDDLYREQLEEWQRQGVVDVRWAFSRAADESEGCAHINDRIWHDRQDIVDLWRNGANVFVCGSRGVADSAKGAILQIFREETTHREEDDEGQVDADEDRAEAWFQEQRNFRYLMDVFD